MDCARTTARCAAPCPPAHGPALPHCPCVHGRQRDRASAVSDSLHAHVHVLCCAVLCCAVLCGAVRWETVRYGVRSAGLPGVFRVAPRACRRLLHGHVHADGQGGQPRHARHARQPPRPGRRPTPRLPRLPLWGHVRCRAHHVPDLVRAPLLPPLLRALSPYSRVSLSCVRPPVRPSVFLPLPSS